MKIGTGDRWDAAELTAKTQALLRRTFGPQVDADLAGVIYGYDGAPSVVARCAVSGLPGGRKTVVAKRSNLRQGHLRTEWASLLFLADIPDVADLVPTAFAADLDEDLLVLEDLGDMQPVLLGNILCGDDAPRARAALMAFHQALARLHGATAGLESAWQARVADAQAVFASRHRVHRFNDALDALPDRFRSAGVSITDAFARECADVAQTLADPGPWCVFTHGDGTPANASFDGETLRLFDFETGGFRHACVDGSFPVVRWLHSIWAQGIPGDLCQDLRRTYRDELARWLPEAAGAEFEQGLVACSIAWLAGLLALPDLFERDKKWGAITFRERALAGLAALAQLTHETGCFRCIGDGAQTSLEHWSECWSMPVAPLPIYPALRVP